MQQRQGWEIQQLEIKTHFHLLLKIYKLYLSFSYRHMYIRMTSLVVILQIIKLRQISGRVTIIHTSNKFLTFFDF